MRSLAAYSSDARVRDVLNGLVMKGQDFFRSGVIEALGDYKAAYALPRDHRSRQAGRPLAGGRRARASARSATRNALETLAALQRTAPKNVQQPRLPRPSVCSA